MGPGGPMGMPPPHRHGGDSFGGGRKHSVHRDRERSLEEISATVWLTPENASFVLRNGLLYLILDGKETRVTLRRAFPFDTLWEFISVLNEDEDELGIVRDITLFAETEQTILREELERRYYSPKILKILAFKERYGFSHWRVLTAEGEMRFTLHDTYKSLVRVSEKRVLLLDVDGNRFEIPDLTALDKKSYRKIELYL